MWPPLVTVAKKRKMVKSHSWLLNFGQAITHIIFVHSPLVIQPHLTVRWLKKCGDSVLGRKVVEEMCLDL